MPRETGGKMAIKLTDKKLLKLWADICKERAGWKCEVADCNTRGTQLHAHHIFSRRHASLRYRIDNAICLCSVHHSLGSFSAHSDPTFKDRLVACGVRPPELFEELSRERNRIQKNTLAWKLECYERLKAYL
jgi:hypothetical protein